MTRELARQEYHRERLEYNEDLVTKCHVEKRDMEASMWSVV